MVRATSWQSQVLAVVTLVGALSVGGLLWAQAFVPESRRAETDFTAGTTLDMLRTQDVIARGVATDGSAVQTGYAATMVRGPIAHVLAAILDVDQYHDFMPQFEQSRQLGRSERSEDVFLRFAVNPLIHLWARLRYQISPLHDGAVEVYGHEVQGNLARMEVRWRATPVDTGHSTVLEFWSFVLPNFPVPLPLAVLDDDQVQAARHGVEAFRQRAEAGAVSTPIAAPMAQAAR